MPANLSRETRILEYPFGIAKPEDLLTFVHFNMFTRAWKAARLDDDDLRALETCIMADPRMSPVVPGTGGLRKLRFAPSRWRVGKRGALRVVYVYLEEYSLVGLVLAYPKNQKEDTTEAERRSIQVLIGQFREFVENGGMGR